MTVTDDIATATIRRTLVQMRDQARDTPGQQGRADAAQWLYEVLDDPAVAVNERYAMILVNWARAIQQSMAMATVTYSRDRRAEVRRRHTAITKGLEIIARDRLSV